jgi:hypothetical protein
MGSYNGFKPLVREETTSLGAGVHSLQGSEAERE